MDYETKIYLDKFIEAIEELNNPDWWMIVLTIINIAAFVFVAYTQIKLQKQQTIMQEQQAKIEEYKRYLSLYIPVQSLKSEIDDFIKKLWYYLDRDIDDDINKIRLSERKKTLELLKKDLHHIVADLELQFKLDSNYKNDYIEVIDKMIKILIQLDKIIHNTSYDTDKKGSMLIIYDGKEDEGFYEAIKEFIPNNEIHDELYSFILLKKCLPNKDLIDKIRERCKIE